MPDDAEAEHPVAGINYVQARIGDDLKNSKPAGFVVIIVLIEMVTAIAERMVHFNVFLGHDVAVLVDYLKLAYIVADGPVGGAVVYHLRASLSVAESGVKRKDVMCCRLPRWRRNSDCQCWIQARTWIFVGCSFAVLDRHLEILEHSDDFRLAVLGAQIDLPADLSCYPLNITVASLDLQIYRLVVFDSEVVELYRERQLLHQVVDS